MTRPLPAHGSYARANGSPGYRKPCPCETCLTVRRRAKKTHRVNSKLGRPGRIDAGLARKRLLQLHQHADWEAIAKAANLMTPTIRGIADGATTRIYRTTHAKIMAARPEASAGRVIDSTGTRRRIRALQARGHSQAAIAAEAHTTETRIRHLCNGDQPGVRKHVADRLAAAYTRLADQPGTSQRAINRAANEKWPDPTWWEDWGGIDDPNAPEVAVDPETPRFLALAEDGLWLEQQGFSRQHAAERLGVERHNLQKSIDRARKVQAELGEAA